MHKPLIVDERTVCSCGDWNCASLIDYKMMLFRMYPNENKWEPIRTCSVARYNQLFRGYHAQMWPNSKWQWRILYP